WRRVGDQGERRQAEAAAAMADEYLALDSTAQGGAALEKFRRQTRGEERLALRVFRMHRLATTRNFLGDRVSAALCRQGVGLWISGLSGEEAAAIDSQAERLATSLALDAPALHNRFVAAAASFGGGDPLARLEPELLRSLEEIQFAPEGTVPHGATQQVLARLEAFLGAP